MHDSSRDDFDRGDGDIGIEELLRRYRPIDPPAELRTRILARLREPPVRRAWPWAVAAAALLLVTLASHVALDREAAKTAAVMTSASETHARVAADLTEMLGGDDEARRLAELIIAEQTARRESAPDTSGPASPEGALP